jgi:adenylosuccinate lyase
MIKRYSLPLMESVWNEDNKFAKWLEVEIAACEAWHRLGTIPKKDLNKIKLARFNLKRMDEILIETHHDMTAFLGSVAESLGPESRFIHLGMTSSDVMDTALSLQMVEAASILDKDVKELTNVLAHQSMEHKYTLMIGRSHGVHAEPTSFGLKLALWTEEMRRNRRRLNEATKMIAVGQISGAVGTYATIPPEVEEIVCARLGLAPTPISNQVIQRDRHAQFLTTIAIIGGSLEKFATEIRGLQKTETREVEEPFQQGQTGSSSMPHKRNPELCERISGLARMLRGYAVTGLENIALWHERDISHSSTERITMPDACILLDYMLNIFTSIIKDMLVYPENMKKNLDITRGLVFSQRVMLALIDKGLKREVAYKIVQRNAMKTWEGDQRFLNFLKEDKEVTNVLSEKELGAIFDYQYYLRHVDDIYKRLGLTSSQWKKNLLGDKQGRLTPGSIS